MDEFKSIADISGLIQSIGVTAVFMWLYAKCRSEREQIRNEYIAELKSQIKSLCDRLEKYPPLPNHQTDNNTTKQP